MEQSLAATARLFSRGPLAERVVRIRAGPAKVQGAVAESPRARGFRYLHRGEPRKNCECVQSLLTGATLSGSASCKLCHMGLTRWSTVAHIRNRREARSRSQRPSRARTRTWLEAPAPDRPRFRVAEPRSSGLRRATRRHRAQASLVPSSRRIEGRDSPWSWSLLRSGDPDSRVDVRLPTRSSRAATDPRSRLRRMAFNPPRVPQRAQAL